MLYVCLEKTYVIFEPQFYINGSTVSVTMAFALLLVTITITLASTNMHYAIGSPNNIYYITCRSFSQLGGNIFLFWLIWVGMAFGNFSSCGVFSYSSLLPEFMMNSLYKILQYSTHFVAYHFSLCVISWFIYANSDYEVVALYSVFHGLPLMTPVHWEYHYMGIVHKYFTGFDGNGAVYVLCTSVICLCYTLVCPRSLHVNRAVEVISPFTVVCIIASSMLVGLSVLHVQMVEEKVRRASTNSDDTSFMLLNSVGNFIGSAAFSFLLSAPFTFRKSTPRHKLYLKVSVSIVVGFVSVSSSAPVIHIWDSFACGAFGSLLWTGTCQLLDRLQVNDPFDTIASTLLPSIWSYISTAIFINGRVRRLGRRPGLIYGDGDVGLLFAQILACGWTFCWALVSSFIIFIIFRACNQLRERPINQKRLKDRITEAIDQLELNPVQRRAEEQSQKYNNFETSRMTREPMVRVFAKELVHRTEADCAKEHENDQTGDVSPSYSRHSSVPVYDKGTQTSLTYRPSTSSSPRSISSTSAERNTFSTRSVGRHGLVADADSIVSTDHRFTPDNFTLRKSNYESTRMGFGDTNNQNESHYSTVQPTVMQYTATEVNSFEGTEEYLQTTFVPEKKEDDDMKSIVSSESTFSKRRSTASLRSATTLQSRKRATDNTLAIREASFEEFSFG